MSHATIDRMKSRASSMRSFLGDSRWFHNSILHLQQWQGSVTSGWHTVGLRFKSRAKAARTARTTNSDAGVDHRCATWYATADQPAPPVFDAIRDYVSEDSLDFFDKFASLKERADRPRQRSIEDDRTSVAPTQSNTTDVGPTSTLSTVINDDDIRDWKPRAAPRTKARPRRQPAPQSIWGPELLTGVEVETVYVEVLFSMTHAISSSDFTADTDEALVHLKHSFQLDEVKHQELHVAMHERSPPEVTLKLGVIEARNLKGKTVNGLSDPYCSIWMSSNRPKLLNTAMKAQTLSPVWNELLSCAVKDVNNDVLHVEIWHFNADESVMDKMSHITEVKDCRGFGKLLKGIATASKAAGKPAHEFLGATTIPLKTVPISGTERWFPLAGRDPTKLKERGEIKLSLLMSAVKEEDRLTLRQSYQQYELCLRALIEQELRIDPEWRGGLGPSASIILRQFAAHRGLRPAVTDVCLWTAYVTVMQRRTLDFSVMHDLLLRLDSAFNDSKLPEETSQIFWAAADKFIENVLHVVRHLRSNPKLRTNPTNLISLLQCLDYFMDKRQSTYPELRERISEAITMGAADWWVKAGRRRTGGPISDDNRLEHSIRTCQMLMDDLKDILTWQNDCFLQVLQIPCFSVAYKYYDGQLASLCRPVVDSMTRSLKLATYSDEKVRSLALEAAGESPRPAPPPPSAERESSPEQDPVPPKLTMGTALFELYLSIQQFHKLATTVTLAERENLKLVRFHLWFSTAVCRWLDIAVYKAMMRIGRAVACDAFVPVDPLAKHSSSAVDTVTVFYQVKTFWEQLSWPDTEGALTFVLKMIDDVHRCSTFYAEAITAKLERLNMEQSGEVFFVSRPVCVAIYSILHVRQSIQPLAEHMGVTTLCRALHESNSEASLVTEKTKETLMENAVDNMNAKLEEIFFSVARRIESEVAKMIEADRDLSSSPVHVDRLVQYLDGNLKTLNTQLDESTFDRLLDLISQRVLHTFHNFICKDVENKRMPDRFRQWDDLLKVMTDFFYGSETTEKEDLDEILCKIRHLLKLHGSESSYLMQQYHLERMRETPDDAQLGLLTIQAVFAQDKLIVKILNGRNLKGMDSRGSADPYVKVQIVPRDKLTEAPIYKTKVQKNTLFPLFDETFIFFVPLELQNQADCFLVLTVKDHDLLGANEFMGEAFSSFQKIASQQCDIQDADQFHLILTKPSNKDSENLQILETRTWDKAAKEFVKRERKRMNGK